ncbi:MAG: carboxymuconolactone decarboxylase family protein [Candidatus Baltobacteraceae bacterium]
MDKRLDYATVAPGALTSLYAAGAYVAKSTLGATLVVLVQLRASQINGCEFCKALHKLQAEALDVGRERIADLPNWKDSNAYSARERAALLWTEHLTLISQNHVPQSVYDSVRAEFSEVELVDLTLAITTINAWNRFAIAFATPPAQAEVVFKTLHSHARPE